MEEATGTTLPLVARAARHAERTAILDADGEWSYRQLLAASAGAAAGLLAGAADLGEARVAFLVPPGFAYPAVQWGIWRAGGIAVPLCSLHPRPELEHVLDDAGATVVVAHPEFAERLQPLAAARGARFLLAGHLLAAPPAPLPAVEPERRALILYTSGTTGRPKGVVTTHANVAAQVTSLVAAWDWRTEDRVLHVLPLHHIHGIINVLTCALWTGASCRMLPRFDPAAAWDAVLAGDLTLFMAVPTIYEKLIAAWEAAPPARQRALSAAARGLRLMVSGSAALPVRTLARWQALSGHTLLERYGMTEIGMGLSNPLHGERRPGSVGTPLPGVAVMLADEAGQPVPPGAPGEILVRGPGVFQEYWANPAATAAAFRDGWFRTGDVAALEAGRYRILGRSSTDIIKTGGYKVSALEIEEALREHPAVRECAVVGVADPEWGERVAAALVLKEGGSLTLAELRAWARERLAVYKVPTRLQLTDSLPRNAMGKVIRPEVARLFAGAA
jgi:malonyl-CoA/methylmalonyl-CoA synthetase